MACVLAASHLAARAGEPEAAERGLEIAREADRRDSGFGDSESAVVMTLRTAGGQESRRAMRIRMLEATTADEGDRSLVVFDEPRDIAGTALLSHTRILEPDDQWVFLPAGSRSRRISGANRAGSFVGSEFSYEDLATPHIDKFNYRYVREEACGDGELTCHVIERIPRYRDSGYARQIVWLDSEHYRPWRIEFHDRRDRHFKTLQYSEFHQYGRFWRAHLMTMTNHRNGKVTELAVSAYRFGVGFTESDFTRGSLHRVR